MVNYDEMAKEVYELFSCSSPHAFPLLARKVSQGEFRMITTIEKNGNDISSGDLASAMRLSSGRTSILLNVLEKKGYIERDKEKNDHRVVHVHLSNSGKKICSDFEEEALVYASRFLAKLGEEDAKDFLRLLKKIVGICNTNETSVQGE
jgi:DNA-binding MarR family transcriptional regulator